MRRSLLILGLLAGCHVPQDPAPDEVALERYYEADKLLAAGRYAEAAPHYEFVIEHRDRVIEAYHKLARCHEALGAEPRAVEVLEAARRVDRRNVVTLRELARMYARQGRVDAAIDACRMLLEIDAADERAKKEIVRLEELKKAK